jgi:hypothetical protein
MMLKKITYTAVLLSIYLVISSFANPEKKIDKIVSKVWKGVEFTLSKIEVPDSLKTDMGRLHEVLINDQTAGYVCYTTAFGCKVGGCAAPTNPNVQSYETFDYVVVYDTSFSIMKVDIAEYGGQYGYEICRVKWLQQFVGGRKGFKLGANVDGITGATVSAQFLIDDLNDVGSKIELCVDESLAGK